MLCDAKRMQQKHFQETTSALLLYLDTTAFLLNKMGAFWVASLVAQPLYNATYATWELRHIVESIFIDISVPLNGHDLFGCKQCVFYEGHYLGIDVCVYMGPRQDSCPRRRTANKAQTYVFSREICYSVRRWPRHCRI